MKQDSGARTYSLGILAGVIALTTLGFGIFQAVTTRLLLQGHGCGWDGLSYCRMARGLIVLPPFERRPLAPAVVRAMHFGTILDRFLVLDLIGIGAISIITGALVARLCADLPRRRAVPAAVIAGCVLALNPGTLHDLLSYPANTDDISLALGLAWLVLFLRDKPILSALFACAACLAREQWGPVILAVCVVDVAASRRWKLAVAAVAASIGALAFDYSRPYKGGQAPSTFSVMHQWFVAHFVADGGPQRLIWMLIFGVGLVPLLALTIGARRAMTRDVVLPATAAAVSAVLSILGGDDTARLMLPSTAIGTALAAAAVARAVSLRFDLTLAAAFIGSLAIWQPWFVVRPQSFLEFFAPYYAAGRAFTTRFDRDLPLALATIALMIATLASSRVAALFSRQSRSAANLP